MSCHWDACAARREIAKKFKYSEVIHGGRRQRLLEPLEWLIAAGMVTQNNLTKDCTWPLSAYNEEDGSFFKVYMADTGLMFYKFGIDGSLFLNASRQAPVLSAEFRGALAESATMQALASNGVQTFYWVPPDSWKAKGELDFVFQTTAGELVPCEVKSGRNVRAKTLASFMRRGGSPYAIRLSDGQFGRGRIAEGAGEVRELPLYAAHCIADGLVRVGV